MKIAHIVTYVSADGAWGGPVTVARNLAVEQARRGHEVDLFAAWDGVGTLDAPGVALKLFRRSRITRRLRSVFAPKLLWSLWISRGRFDVIHVHVGRDLVTGVGALAAGGQAALVLQPHGMIAPDGRALSRLYDRWVTKRVFHRARIVLTLTDDEETALRRTIAGGFVHARLHNGIDAEPVNDTPGAHNGEVLYVSRLASRKRPVAFVEMAEILSARNSDVRFVIIGPDEGELENVENSWRRMSSPTRLTYEGPLPQQLVRERMRSAAAMVLPSVGEVFPMAVLEAMSVGVPVVMTTDCGMAEAVSSAEAAIVTGFEPGELASGVDSLLADDGLRERVTQNALQLVRSTWSISAVVDSLEGYYRSAQSSEP